MKPLTDEDWVVIAWALFYTGGSFSEAREDIETSPMVFKHSRQRAAEHGARLKRLVEEAGRE